jgi:hypothetical protein
MAVAAPRCRSAQRPPRVRKGVERPIGVEQFRPQRPVDGGNAREGEIQRPLGERPEIQVATRQRQRPGIFELFAAPDLGEALRIGTGRGAMAADSGVHVEQGSVGVEDESARHGGPPS